MENSINKKVVLLTGGSGHLGLKVLEKLEGKEIGTLALIRGNKKNKDYNFIEIHDTDLKNIELSNFNGSSFNGIIHLASSRSMTLDDILNIDIKSTAYLTELWNEGNFIYTSSAVVYGHPPKKNINIKTLLNPLDNYSLGKVCSEFFIIKKKNEFLDKKINEYSNYIILRFPLIFGFNDCFTNEQFLFYLYENAFNNYNFYFRKEANYKKYGASWISLNDLSNLICRALFFKSSSIFNVSSGFVRWFDLLELIIKSLNSKSKIVLKSDINNKYFMLPHSITKTDNNDIKYYEWQPEDKLEDIINDFTDNYLKFKNKQIKEKKEI